MPDTVLVLGAAGFVGRRLVPFLAATGRVVVPYGRGDGPLAAVVADRTITHVVNSAGRTFVPDSWNDPVPFYADNVLVTAEALRVCRQYNAPLVHLSSYVYGVPQHLPIAETHPVVAVNPYAHSKIVAESVVAFHCQHLDVRATVIRPFNLYGPGQGPQFVIPTIVSQLLDRSTDVIEVADLRPKRDYLHVDDLLDLIDAALRFGLNGTYNAGSGYSVSVAEVAREAGRVAGVTKDIRDSGKRRQNEVLDVVSDISAAFRDFGWAPRRTLADGLREIIAAFETTGRV